MPKNAIGKNCANARVPFRLISTVTLLHIFVIKLQIVFIPVYTEVQIVSAQVTRFIVT